MARTIKNDDGLKQGTLLVTTKYIRCNMLGFQFDAGRELRYVSTYKGMYLVEFADKSYMSYGTGYAGVLMAVNPCDVKIMA